MEANANRYTWVWKKSCVKNRDKVFEKVSALIDSINIQVLNYQGIGFEKRNEYAIDYLEELLEKYTKIPLDKDAFAKVIETASKGAEVISKGVSFFQKIRCSCLSIFCILDSTLCCKSFHDLTDVHMVIIFIRIMLGNNIPIYKIFFLQIKFVPLII